MNGRRPQDCVPDVRARRRLGVPGQASNVLDVPDCVDVIRLNWIPERELRLEFEAPNRRTAKRLLKMTRKGVLMV